MEWMHARLFWNELHVYVGILAVLRSNLANLNGAGAILADSSRKIIVARWNYRHKRQQTQNCAAVRP